MADEKLQAFLKAMAPEKKPETAKQRYARNKLRFDSKKLKADEAEFDRNQARGELEVDGEPLDYVTEDLTDENKFHSQLDIKKKRESKRGQTATQVTDRVAGDIIDLNKKLIDPALPDPNATDEALDEQEKLGDEYIPKPDPTREALNRSISTKQDTMGYVNQIRNFPDVFGKDPDMDIIFGELAQYEQVVDAYNYKVDETFNDLMAELGKGYEPTNPEGSYQERLAYQTAQQLSAEELKPYIPAGQTLESMAGKIQLVTGMNPFGEDHEFTQRMTMEGQAPMMPGQDITLPGVNGNLPYQTIGEAQAGDKNLFDVQTLEQAQAGDVDPNKRRMSPKFSKYRR